MNGWLVVFLGILALSSLTQTVFLVVLALEGRRASARVSALQDRIEKDLRPSLESLARVSKNFAEVSELGVQQAQRIDAALTDTLEKVESTTEAVRQFVLRPLGPIGEIVAVLKGVRRGVQVYNQLRGFDGGVARGKSRAYADDEHLFI
jgi:hypothetical protein